MKKLTEKDDCGNWCLKGVSWESLRQGAVITKEVSEKLYGALWKLMEYEDTELTPEGIVEQNDFFDSQTAKILQQLQEYQKLGTVEECLAAVEKQKPKRPSKLILDHRKGYECPNCGNEIERGQLHCWCGQRIDWSEVDWSEEE